MVITMARAEMLGIFGAAGLDLDSIERAVDELSGALGRQRPWGVNLIFSPAEPALEEGTAELLLRRGVRIISASAYLDITLPLARCAAGLRLDPAGRIVRPGDLRQGIPARGGRSSCPPQAGRSRRWWPAAS
jgi:hypothetical protein